MKRIVNIIFLTLCALGAHALQHVEGVGTRAVVVNGTDTLLFFDGYPELRVVDGTRAYWRYEDGSLCQDSSVYASTIQSGRGIRVSGPNWTETVYVFNYADYRPQLDSVTVEAIGCDSSAGTTLHIFGTVPAITYPRSATSTGTYARTCKISYIGVEWNGTEWADRQEAVVKPLKSGLVSIPPFYRSTAFTVLYDTIAYSLYDQWDSIVSEVVRPHAVMMMPTSVTTTRGDRLENEVERPIKDTILSGSASLDIQFFCNPTEAGEYFEWRIYKGGSLLTSRTDESVRYTFVDQGEYTVSGRAYHPECNCIDPHPGCKKDSVLFRVSTAMSQLKVPNVFTPNGDGANDEFRVLYESIREYHIWIYDRWGHLVYKSDDPAKGWDGTVNGRPCSMGAYYYVIRALGAEAPADSSYGTKIAYKKKVKQSDSSVLGIYRLSGDINLIR